MWENRATQLAKIFNTDELRDTVLQWLMDDLAYHRITVLYESTPVTGVAQRIIRPEIIITLHFPKPMLRQVLVGKPFLKAIVDRIGSLRVLLIEEKHHKATDPLWYELMKRLRYSKKRKVVGKEVSQLLIHSHAARWPPDITTQMMRDWTIYPFHDACAMWTQSGKGLYLYAPTILDFVTYLTYLEEEEQRYSELWEVGKFPFPPPP